jgi:hypothetical protein
MWTLCCESTSPGNGTASRKWEGVFFVVAPDGLCYCLGERQSKEDPAVQ